MQFQSRLSRKSSKAGSKDSISRNKRTSGSLVAEKDVTPSRNEAASECSPGIVIKVIYDKFQYRICQHHKNEKSRRNHRPVVSNRSAKRNQATRQLRKGIQKVA